MRRRTGTGRRRSAEEWWALLEGFTASGLTLPQYCARECIGIASYHRWRRLLSVTTRCTVPTSAAKVAAVTPALVDLGALTGLSRDSPGSRRWRGPADRARLMFFAEGQIRVHLYGSPADMRKSYDGLQALTRHAMGQDPASGALYVFVNRRGNQLKTEVPVLRSQRVLPLGQAARARSLHPRVAPGAHAGDGLNRAEVAAEPVTDVHRRLQTEKFRIHHRVRVAHG